MNKIRTRFAPSPTGELHLGNIRTAFFCWLHAKKHNGQFILRIDDTNKNKKTDYYTKKIIENMQWLSLLPNENIIFQSKRQNRYKKVLDYLLYTKKAYRCFCDKSRLLDLKNEQKKYNQKLIYDNFCKNKKYINKNSNFVIRINNQKNTKLIFTDQIKGKICILSDEIGDFILAKQNYQPTYNFATVVDDVDFTITDIIRGEDHISNTFKHISIMNLLNAHIPRFAHLPMVLDEEGKPLSKREKSNNIQYYKKHGFLPEAILNYIIRLGWSHKNKELFSLNEMIKLFNIKNITKSSSMFNYNKLLWLNKYFVKNVKNTSLTQNIIDIINDYKINKKFIINQIIIDHQRPRVNTVQEIINNSLYIYTSITIIKYNMYKYKNIIIYIIKKLNIFLNNNNIYINKKIKNDISKLLIKNNLQFNDIAKIIRITNTYKNCTTPIFNILLIQNKVLTLKKFKNIIEYFTYFINI